MQRIVVFPVFFSLQVYEFVQLPELYYAGSHGMDIMGPANGCKGHKSQGKKMSDDEVVLIFFK